MKIIGIVPDVISSGVGVVDDGKVIEQLELSFYELLEFIDRQAQEGAVFVMEDVAQNLPTPKNTVPLSEHDRINRERGQMNAVFRLLAQHPALNAANLMQVSPLEEACRNNFQLFRQFSDRTRAGYEEIDHAALLALYCWRVMIRIKAHGIRIGGSGHYQSALMER